MEVFVEHLDIALELSTSFLYNFTHMLQSMMCLLLDTVLPLKMHLHYLNHWHGLFISCPTLFTTAMCVLAIYAYDRGPTVSQHWILESLTLTSLPFAFGGHYDPLMDMLCGNMKSQFFS